MDEQLHRWVTDWLSRHGLPVVESGSYYVKSFRIEPVPASLESLRRGDVVRLCFKPHQT